jgi:hypothetical protein
MSCPFRTDTHFVSLVPGWSAPINNGPFGSVEVKGVQAASPYGGTSVVRLHTAGLYYYYCAAHATINSSWHRAQAQQDASEYPVPMEGFILVGGG